MNTIESLMQIEFNVQIDPEEFLSMDVCNRDLLFSSLSEKEKFENLINFKTLPDGKVGWKQK